MQVTVQHSLPKHQEALETIAPLSGHNSLLTIEGKQHKRWRNIFNPGFSNAHIMTLVDGIVDDSRVFMDILGKHADAKEVFLLEEAATRVTVDIIGRVVLYDAPSFAFHVNGRAHFCLRDAPMNAQTSENELFSAFRHTMMWLRKSPNFNPFSIFNPYRPLVHELNRRKMNKYLGKVMDDRLAAGYSDKTALNKKNGRKHARPIIDLALDAYAQEFGTSAVKAGKIDPTFRAAMMDHIKIFMLAGHDTTSSTICYAAHALSQHPEALAKVLKEYDDVFGSNVTQTAARIKEDPYLINKLPFTVAIIKETLRLWPPASSVRKGEPGFFVHCDGKQYPTEGFMVWPMVFAIQHDPASWPSPLSFLPERWLAVEGDPLYPLKGAWRPFEFGPRNCIGQELAMVETKIILALMLRQFDVRAAYGEVDSEEGTQGVKTTPEGERAYQVLFATAKPAQGMPARVKRRSL